MEHDAEQEYAEFHSGQSTAFSRGSSQDMQRVVPEDIEPSPRTQRSANAAHSFLAPQQALYRMLSGWLHTYERLYERLMDA